MKRTILSILAVLLASGWGQTNQPSVESLFDGANYTLHWRLQPEPGIHGDGGHWGVTNDGALFGEQEPPGSGNGGLLLTREKFSEFELEIDLKPDWGPDSGIFLRTNERGEGWQVYVDHHDNGNVGHIRLETQTYSVPFRPFKFVRVDKNGPGLRIEVDERTQNWPEDVFAFTCTPENFLAAWKADDWNTMRIRCTGKTELPRIETWINDRKICTFDAAKTTHPGFDPEKAKTVVGKEGYIGLQVHKGRSWPDGARVFWKSIKIRRLGD